MLNQKDFAINLARQAGQIMKANFRLGMEKTWKEDNTPLTKADLEINQLVIDSVKKNFPGQSILAEEQDAVIEGSEYTWVCDPIDGTIPFSHGVPTCVFSLALLRNGESILGVIYDPFLDRMFAAEKGKGAFLNGKKISVSRAGELKSHLVGLGFWKSAPYNFLKLYSAIFESEAHIVKLGSITYMGSLVASGELVATIFAGNKPHDTAALKVIVEEAGGKVTDIWGNEQRYDQDIKGHLASNGILHDELLKLIKETVKY